MNLFFPNTTGLHSLLRASIFTFPSISVHKTRNKLLLGCHADSIRVELNDNSDAKSSGGEKIDSIDKCSDFCLESDECVEVIVVGSRKDAMLDFCSGSPFLSPALRFWNVVGHDSKAQLQRRFTKQDHTLRTAEEFSEQQSSCKAVVLVASAAYGSDHITALNVLNNIKSGSGLVVGIILKPFSFEGQRRQDEVKDLVEKVQKLANFCIVLDTDTLLENDLVTLDEALRTSNNAVLMAMNVIPILISERHIKLGSTKDNSTKELQLPGFKKIIESYNKARIGFGAGYNVKTSLLRAINDCPFLGVDVKDMDGVLLCVFSSSDVTDCGDANTILQTVQVTTRCNSEIIVSIVHEPNLEPNAILTAVIAFGDTRQQLAPKNGIFSNLGRHFPFIFNIFKKNYQQPIDTEEDYSSKSPKVSDVMNSPAISDVPDANSLDGATETDVYSGKIQPLLGNSDEEFGSSSINSEDGDELWEADSVSSIHDLNVEGPQMFKRELLTGGIQGPGQSMELSKFGANFSESSALVDSVSIYKLPVGVKQLEKSDDNLLTSNIKHGADGRVDENNKKQPHDSPSVPRSGLAEAGVYAAAAFDSNDSAFNKGNYTINSKKQGILSIRAASMLESERDLEKKWSRVVEMKYWGGIYRGRAQGGLPEGKGRLLLGDGSIYDGMWRYGKRSGLGTFCFNNGDVFQGSWRDDVMHGKGWFYFHTGDRWFVNFWKGKANGEGRFYSKLGDIFFGHFKEGWRHGHFLHINVDGTRSQEVWDEGVLVSDEPLDLDSEDVCSQLNMATPIMPLVSLKGCEKAMPVIGMGTASYPPADLETTKAAILEAIKAGYRHFDTAFAYGSEKALGEAVAEAIRAGLIESRDQLFITTKLWCSFAEPTQIVPSCKLSLRNLQLDYVDLYLIHWPIRLTEMVSKTPVAKELIRPLDVKGVWKSMEECKNLGLTKAIGLSNFSCKMVQEILSIATIPPAVNQVEINPVWQQKQLRDFCREKGIHVTGYSPLGANNTKWGDNRIIESDVLSTIASDRGKTTAQVALRWVYEQGVSIVSKSFNKERMKENLQIFDWSLAKEDLEKIGQLPQHKGTTLAFVLGPHDLVLELDAQV